MATFDGALVVARIEMGVAFKLATDCIFLNMDLIGVCDGVPAATTAMFSFT